jgi:hypothetical protein
MSRRIDERARYAQPGRAGSESGLDIECVGSWQDEIVCHVKSQ